MKTLPMHLVIPCYRESFRIRTFLQELCRLSDMDGKIRIQVIDDGSGQSEQAKMRDLVDGYRERYESLLPLTCLPQNLGKGGAVYYGWNSTQGEPEWLGFVDADGSCSPAETLRMIQYARLKEKQTVASAVFASRIKMLGRSVHRDVKRHLLGRVYATLVSEILDVPVYDSQCGLKLVSRKAYAQIAPTLKINGFAFDVELMVSLLDQGYSIEEFPIDWHETPGGKVKLLSDSWRMFRDVMKIKKNRVL